MPLYVPQLYEEETSRTMTASFFGLNRNLKIADGEWADMKNLTSDNLPVLSVREKRAILDIGAEEPIAIIGGTTRNGGVNLIWVEKTGRLCIGNATESYDLKEYGFDDKIRDINRRLVYLGAYLIIAPEMIYINTADPTGENSIGSIRGNWQFEEAEGSQIIIEVCDYEGNTPQYTQVEDPTLSGETPRNGELWHKTDDGPNLYRYDLENSEWYKVQSYLRIACIAGTGLAKINLPGEIKTGDVIRMSGSVLENDELKQLAGDKYVSGVAESGSMFWVEGFLTESQKTINMSEGASFVIERAIPQFDYVTVSDNRLWGAFYGEKEQEDGKKVVLNEIYCSRRGDFFRWYIGPSDDDDSPVTFSVGSNGDFTGALEYNGEPLFFKENKLYRISGFGASGFRLIELPCEGIMSGCGKSAAVVNGSLYYKGISGVMRYDGSVPITVSDDLGNLREEKGLYASALGNKYVVMLADGQEKRDGIYVLDTDKGIWTKEEGELITELTKVADNVLFLEYKKIKSIKPISGWLAPVLPSTMETNQIKWHCTSGIIGLETPDDKYLTKIAIRMKLTAGSQVRVSVQYDSEGGWHQLMSAQTSAMKTVTVPIIPRKCDHLRFRLDGEGACQVFSITKSFEKAGER